MARRLALLGPQRFSPSVAEVLDDLGVAGEVCLVSAGWREREEEDGELREHLGGRTVENLRLFARAEEAFRGDPELLEAFHRREARLRQLQAVMFVRLEPMKRAAEDLLRREGEAWLLDPEREAAFAALRELDDRHASRVRAISEEFDVDAAVATRPSLVRHREEIAARIASADAVLVAGGHVGVLLTRMLLFGVATAMRDRPVVAWSAGAMAVTGRVVLFHDRPPQGPGTAEVLSPGLGLVSNAVVFPDASRRLDLDDSVRVSLLARRFSAFDCLILDDGAWVRIDDDRALSGRGVELLLESGERGRP